MSFTSADNNTVVTIEMFLLAQSGTYKQQTIRPFVTNVTDDVLKDLERATNNGSRIGAIAVNSIAGSVLQPNANIEGTAVIDNGWDTARYRFLMQVKESHPFMPDNETVRIFFGYSDSYDPSYTGNLDPNMRLFFNSETTLTSQIEHDPMYGPRKVFRPISSNQIISRNRIMQANGGLSLNQPGVNGYSFLIRPEDIFSMRETQIQRDLTASVVPKGIDYAYNYNTLAGEGVLQLNRRRDNSPSRYVSDTLRGLHAAYVNNEGWVEKGSIALYSDAALSLANTSLREDHFLAILRDYGNYAGNGFITLKDFYNIFPAANNSNVTKYNPISAQGIRKLSHTGDSEHWMGADPVTIAASLFAQVVPAIMMDNMIRNIAFACTNGQGIGEYTIVPFPENIKMIINNLASPEVMINNFISRLIYDVLNNISRNNQLQFNVSMTCSLDGESIIDISLYGGPTTRYVAPTFTDSLFAPVVTGMQDTASKVSNDMLYMVESVLANTASATTQSFAHPTQTFQVNQTQPGANNAAYFDLL